MRLGVVVWLVLVVVGCRHPPGSAIDVGSQTGECVAGALRLAVRGDRLGAMAPKVGFLHGLAGSDHPGEQFPKPELVAALKPRFWRVSDGEHVKIAKQFGADVTFVLSDAYSGYDPNFQPWNDFPGWETHVRNTVGAALDAGAAVGWWDIWGEPHGDATKVAESFRRAHEAIRAVDPGAKVVAPSLVAWDEATMASVLDDAVAHGMRLDAVSWHEFDDPASFAAHLKAARALIAARPTLGSPQIHINEYASSEQTLVPALNLAWLQAFEDGHVDQAHRACWDVVESGATWSTCWAGLNAMFLRDEVTPQPEYWLYLRYASMSGERLATDAASDVVAIASVDEASRVVRVLIARGADRRSGPPVNVELAIQAPAFAGASARAELDAIQYTGTTAQVQALPAMQAGPRLDVPVTAGSSSVSVKCVDANEVRSIVLTY